MSIVETVAERGTCDRGRTAVIIVKNKQILATGYVGSPSSQPHCDDVGHEFVERIDNAGVKSQHCVRTSHAEINAIALAAKHGISIEGATMYCKLEPCYTCAKMIVTTGIARVVCKKRYQKGQRTRELFKDAGIILNAVIDEVEQY